MVNKIIQSVSFSIVIPTYTGTEHIDECLEAIMAQQNNKRNKKIDFDVIVVIDGPNAALRRIVDEWSVKFKKFEIPLTIIQFKENNGRFKARLAGVRKSEKEHILLIDDRNNMAHDYIKQVINTGSSVLIPNVLENEHPNLVSLTLFYLRKKIYGEKWGGDFESYDITRNNFEKSPKGTTSLWIPKNLFIEVCEYIMKEHGDIRHISDDTKVLRAIVDKGISIRKSSEAKIYYQPRKRALTELLHIFHRGPLFVDYYLKRGSPYFLHLLILYVGTILIFAIFVTHPISILYILSLLLVGVIFAGVLLSKSLTNGLQIGLCLILICLSFLFGVYEGLLIKIKNNAHIRGRNE